MEIRVLGPLEVVEDGRAIAIASQRQRALLALLLIHAGRPVSTESILDALWGDSPPESGAGSVAFHVSRLRAALEPGRGAGTGTANGRGPITTEAGGYSLRIEPDAIDAARFERLASEGHERVADDPAVAAARLREALALWRGEPFADLADLAFLQPEIARLRELRLRAFEDRFEADLALGRGRDIAGELEALVAEEPLREHLRAQLMRALYGAGRQADALRVYQEGRRLLADELGIDPSPELQALELAILRQDATLDVTRPAAGPRNPYKGLRPFGEADAVDFFGREMFAARLLERLDAVSRAGGLLLLVGPSGSGKSSVIRAGLLPLLRAAIGLRPRGLAGRDHASGQPSRGGAPALAGRCRPGRRRHAVPRSGPILPTSPPRSPGRPPPTRAPCSSSSTSSRSSSRWRPTRRSLPGSSAASPPR